MTTPYSLGCFLDNGDRLFRPGVEENFSIVFFFPTEKISEMFVFVKEDGSIDESTYDPDELEDQPEPECVYKNGIYYLRLKDDYWISGATVTVNSFGPMLSPQLLYEDGGVKIRLVNANSQPKQAPFTLHIRTSSTETTVQAEKLSEVFSSFRV